jgi:hypothetical protein
LGMPVTIGSTSPMKGGSRKKEAMRKRLAEEGRRQAGAVLSEAADRTAGGAAVSKCRASTTEASCTACRTTTKHGGSVSVPYDELQREPPCETTAREAVELQLSAARRAWIDAHQALGLEVNEHEPVLVTQGSALPAVAARQAAHADAGQCRHR